MQMQFLKGEENGIIWDSAKAPSNEIKDESNLSSVEVMLIHDRAYNKYSY